MLFQAFANNHSPKGKMTTRRDTTCLHKALCFTGSTFIILHVSPGTACCEQTSPPPNSCLCPWLPGALCTLNHSSKKPSTQAWLNSRLSGEQLLIPSVGLGLLSSRALQQNPPYLQQEHGSWQGSPCSEQHVFTHLHPCPDQTPGAVSSQSLLQGS